MTNSKWLCLILFLIFLLQLSFSTPTLSSPPTDHLCSYEQSLALLQFKQNFSIDSFAYSYYCDYYNGQSSQPKTKSWNKTIDCCKWDGVTCDALTGHVIGLDLSCSQLKGIIPSNSTLFQLFHLEELNLAYNDFSPSLISNEFSVFTSLKILNLSSSGYSGQIPSGFLRLSELVSLDLSLNNQGIKIERNVFEILLRNLTQLSELSLIDVNISSVLPMNLSSSFTYLDLSYTELRGQLPDNIFHLPNLQTLKLTNCGLNGHLPKVNASSSSPLMWLDLSFTSFLGEVLDSIVYLKNLNYLQLDRCNLFGPIPKSIGNLTQITDLHLYDNDFDGEIPSTLSNLEKLASLDFSFNNLKGQVPNVFGKLKHLSSLSLDGNNFDGPFPSSIANLTQLHRLFLSSNSFAGPIPSIIVGLQNLKILRLANNSFNGSISSWLFTLPSLLTVDLSDNRFVGQIDDFQSRSVRYIDLSSNYLHGPIPPSISKLVNLTVINLFGNNLTGIVELGVFSNLVSLQQVDLSYNSLTVSNAKININVTFPNLYSLRLSSCKIKDFPYLLRAMVNLESLDLSHNQIYGQLPNWIGSMWMDSLSYLNVSHNFLTSLDSPHPWVNLQVLDLRSNLLQGPLLSSVCNLSSLIVLDLSKNSFTGTIPRCLGNFSNQISVLDLRMNNFHGTIPMSFVKGSRLRNLNLNGNQLQGKLPRSLANCTLLEVLDLGKNQINDTYPQWLGSLLELQVLILRSNRFHGSIGSTSKNNLSFNKLRILDLSHNEFTGLLPPQYFSSFKAMIDVRENKTEEMYLSVPSSPAYYFSIIVAMKGIEIELVKILNVFTTIDLSSNQLEGGIPISIGQLNSLRVLNLSHNNFVDRIPSVLVNLSLLESLDLSSNQLSGEIPQQLTGIRFLAVLNLSKNRLVGRIPRGPQFNTFQSDSYYGNSGLCGFPLVESCADNETSEPPLPRVPEQKDDSDFASGFTWKAVLTGYGCGTVFGVVIGSLVFFTGKPKWFTRIFKKSKRRNVRRPVKRARKPFTRN